MGRTRTDRALDHRRIRRDGRAFRGGYPRSAYHLGHMFRNLGWVGLAKGQRGPCWFLAYPYGLLVFPLWGEGDPSRSALFSLIGRARVVEGKSVSVTVALGGRSVLKNRRRIINRIQ